MGVTTEEPGSFTPTHLPQEYPVRDTVGYPTGKMTPPPGSVPPRFEDLVELDATDRVVSALCVLSIGADTFRFSSCRVHTVAPKNKTMVLT